MYSARRRELLAALGLRPYVLRARGGAAPVLSSSAPWVLLLDPDTWAREAEGKLLRHLRRALGDVPVVTEAGPGVRTVVLGDAVAQADLRLPSLDRLRADPQLKAATWRQLEAVWASSSP
jgi:hypothetical protein